VVDFQPDAAGAYLALVTGIGQCPLSLALPVFGGKVLLILRRSPFACHTSDTIRATSEFARQHQLRGLVIVGLEFTAATFAIASDMQAHYADIPLMVAVNTKTPFQFRRSLVTVEW
jgi:hypothetical protein